MLVITDLLALFLLVTLGFYVFVANPRDRAHQTFAAFNAFLALWTVKDVLFWDFGVGASSPGWWVASSLIIGLLMQYSLAVFAWVFPENRRTPRKQAAVLFAPGAILVPAALFGILWSRVAFDGPELSVSLSASGYLFVCYIFLVFGFGAGKLLKKFRAKRGTPEGKQLIAILWSLVVTVTLMTLAIVILPLLGYQSFLPHTSLLAIPGVLIYAYAILNLRLFNLQTALDEFRLFPISHKIALSVAAVAVLSFVLFQIPIVWWSFSDGMNFEAWRKYLVFSIISALIPNLFLVLLIVRSISRPLQRVTVAAVEVANGAYGAQVDLRPTNDEIGVLAKSFNAMSKTMAMDIERLRELSGRLIQTEKLAALGTLSAGVVHEVNNPLASISSILQSMAADPALDSKSRDDIRTVLAQLERMALVTRDMLDFSQVRPATRRPIEIHTSLRVALRLASFDKEFQKLSLSMELHPGSVKVLGDEDQLQQVFLNLLLNARDAMPNGGNLRVLSKLEGDSVRIEITDSGIGIDPEDATRIFDPFFTTKPVGKGTGLGLAVCYGVVTSHGGTIEMVPATGGGTTFRIDLPGAA